MTKKAKAVLAIKKKEKVAMPAILETSEGMLEALTTALGLPRDILPADEQIAYAWEQLPRLLGKIPAELRDVRLAKMCVAISCGLFDAGLNYIWNAAIISLREKVRRFGLPVVAQILSKNGFDEAALMDLKDSELLSLSLKLNLIGEDDFFFLDQCRATRNNFSVAHPADGEIDEYEFVNFLNRCRKHALASHKNPQGVDIKKLLQALKAGAFDKDQNAVWCKRIKRTSEAQRELIFSMLHGVYCDPDSGEEARNNALSICESFSKSLSPKIQSALLDQHQEYKAQGKPKRSKASTLFFEKVGLLGLLGEGELHSVITKASSRLLAVHNAFDNFHNEPPFAERLLRLTKKNSVPESAQAVFVEAVVTCGMGNQYGVSSAAYMSYIEMVKSFSPAEIQIMLELSQGDGLCARRLKSHAKCKRYYSKLIAKINPKSVPTSIATIYNKWLPKT